MRYHYSKIYNQNREVLITSFFRAFYCTFPLFYLHLIDLSGEIPSEWKPMKGNVLVYKLNPADKEYLDISGKFTTSSGGGFTIQTVSTQKRQAFIINV